MVVMENLALTAFGKMQYGWVSRILNDGLIIVHYTARERNALFWQRCNLNRGKIHLSRMCTMNNCESEEIVEAANIAKTLLPTKVKIFIRYSLQLVQKVVR
ncbi:hypothetical protein NQ317_006917 [Molorchus minor]|uniref:Uncharacterized protein n=1 Tax=Molorchus minor TaxID=1323400 RepID=A0ABQ9JC63_9CUCU|nr:hypothetical protein NQ317_006917 [Molorchus minor]